VPDQFESPDVLWRYALDMVGQLRLHGLVEEARVLEGATRKCCTTGWEWLGELGAAVNVVRGTAGLPDSVAHGLDRISRVAASEHPYG